MPLCGTHKGILPPRKGTIMEENVRILVFRGVPKAIATYITSKNDYSRTPIMVHVDNQGDHDLTIEVTKARHHKVRE